MSLLHLESQCTVVVFKSKFKICWGYLEILSDPISIAP